MESDGDSNLYNVIFYRQKNRVFRFYHQLKGGNKIDLGNAKSHSGDD